jgi:hypothetical protein
MSMFAAAITAAFILARKTRSFVQRTTPWLARVEYLPAAELLVADMIATFFCNEFYFLLHGFPHLLPAAAERAVYSPDSKWPRLVAYASRGLNIAAVILFALGFWSLALIALAPSLAAWVALFSMCKHTVTVDIEAPKVRRGFALCHVGLLNWLFDIPAPKTDCARVIRVLLNITATSAIALGLLLASPLERAWGCYGEASLDALTLGYCADHFITEVIDGVPEGMRWYDLPACYTPLSIATRCGHRDLNTNIASFLDPYLEVGIIATAISMTLYVMAFYKRAPAIATRPKIN